MKIIVGKAGQGIDYSLLDSMFRVRREQFADRLEWNVTVDGQGREVDWYDALGPVYVVAQDDSSGQCLGCMRLLPTVGPNMLKDIFTEKLNCTESFSSRSIWEISRLAISPKASGETSWGFGPAPAALIRAMLSEAWDKGLTAMVGVTTTSVARLMRGFGLDVELLCRPTLIGSAKTVAFKLPVAAPMLDRVGVERRRIAA